VKTAKKYLKEIINLTGWVGASSGSCMCSTGDAEGLKGGQQDGVEMPQYNYDTEADVMYISFGPPQRCKTDDGDHGLLIRTNLKGCLSGITIIGYREKLG